jgi:hypothetical protein
MRTILNIGSPGHCPSGAFAMSDGIYVAPTKHWTVGDVRPQTAIQARPLTVDLNLNTGFSPPKSERCP